MKRDSVILVMPVFNEENCLDKVLNDWKKTLSGLNLTFEILVIDDGSTDKTPLILENLVSTVPEIRAIRQENSGHGAAVKAGYIHACQSPFDYIFQTDSDDQFTSEDFLKLWEKRHESPVVLGERANRKDPLSRKIISFILRKKIFDLFELEIPDPNIPFRLFEKETLKSFLKFTTPGAFAPNIFLSIFAFSQKSKPPVVPVRHFARKGGAQKLMSFGLIKACFQSFWQLVVLSYQYPGFKQEFRSPPENESSHADTDYQNKEFKTAA